MRWSSRIMAGAALAMVAAGCSSERKSLTAPDTPSRHGSSRQVGVGADAAGLSTQDLTQGVTATQLAQTLAGAGITVSNVTFTGADGAAGTFSGGSDIVGFDSGIILSSGIISNVVGPNTEPDITSENLAPGDAALDALTGDGNATQDAAILSFDFVPDGDSVKFQYVFASDEYNEFVNTAFNDVFAFYVNGKNCALVGDPAVPVTINTINNGNPFGSTPASHPELYRNNDLDGGATINTEMDGLTKVLTCSAAVNAGVKNTMRLAIADASDDSYDSNVFLSAKSLTVKNETPTAAISAPLDGDSFTEGSSVSFAGSGSDPEDGSLTGSSLVWTSNKDGQIGTGASFSTSALSLGVHTITLTATDSKGATATATITVNVGFSEVMGPDGGDVCAVGCQVLIFIPKGALAAQTTITVFFAPDAPSAEGMIPGSARTVGPADLSFVNPADMGMIYDPSTLPSGVSESQLRLFRYDGTSWQPISGSVVNTATHVVSGFITAGGTYAIFAAGD